MLRLLVLSISLLVVWPAQAQDRPFVHAAKFDAALLSEVKKQDIVGVAVVVIDQGKVVWWKGYGYADREQRVPVDPQKTQFRWASISKSVTAIAAMQLVEKGLLDLDADVRTYVPEFPDKGVKITTRQLLCHQGGIVHYGNGPVVETKTKYTKPHPFADVVVALDKFKDSPLVHPPGQRQDYSTHGYVLVSAIVERAGKQRFADQVQERVAKPLGMKGFQPDYQWEDITGRAAGYFRSQKDIKRRPDSAADDVSWKLGGGGFTSTATDLAAFALGLLQTKLVSKATQEKMWTPAKPVDPTGSKPYGYGFFVLERPGGVRWVGHDGKQSKTRTAMLLEPASNRAVVMMTNSEWVDPMRISRTLMEIMK
jgi:CubicO group peptidase (beta-lactamase class C family)